MANMKQLSAIEEHGKRLLAIFPNATERDPVRLCKQLRKFERQGQIIALRLCNGPEYKSPEHVDQLTDMLLLKVNGLLGNYEFGDALRRPVVPVFINRDPRGYALKIRDEWMRQHNPRLHQDWGGYGIIAPEISKQGNL